MTTPVNPLSVSLLRGVEEGNRHARFCPDALASRHSYPGSDSSFSSTVFLSLYEEEEAFEEGLAHNSECTPEPPARGVATDFIEASNRPSIYYILRLFDSIKGFHKGSLDLSGRHPERYYLLQSQWNRYLWSLLDLQENELWRYERESNDSRNQIQISQCWRRFQWRWRIPESITYTQLLKCSLKVLKHLKQNSFPKFQQIFLEDLPTEILDNIMGLLSIVEAKALASTSRMLNAIGQRHVFRTWRTSLQFPSHISSFSLGYSNFDLRPIAQDAQKDLKRNAKFVLDTPHVSSCVQKLVLADEWWARKRVHSQENNPFALGMDFYKSISQSFYSILRGLTKISTLILCNLELNLELTHRIANIPTLHTLELRLCRIPHTVIRKLTIDPAFVCSQISNLRIYMDSSFQETYNQWYALLLCPYVRTLSVIQYGIDPFPSPHAMFWTKCRLEHLERLFLDNIEANDLAEFARWVSSSQASNSSLTHFKLHMDWGIPDSAILMLLRSLASASAPLEVLVLEGLAEAEYIVFKEIARLFPDLVALTMVRRQNNSQHQNKLALWPHESWKYAPYFRAFGKLKHFCWNYLTEYWDATPAAMLTFEQESQENPATTSSSFSLTPSTSICSYQKMNKDSSNPHSNISDEAPYFLDSHWMALPFAANCYTLQSFSLMDRAIDMVCCITRNEISGRTCLVPKYSRCSTSNLGSNTNACGSMASPALTSASDIGSGSDAWSVYKWNTVSFHWPALSPLRLKLQGR